MYLFDQTERNDASPKLAIESTFDFLNRSSAEAIQNVRALLEALISDHPEAEEMISRFRSGDDRHFRSAEFELFLFSSLTANGFQLESHPVMPSGVSTRPDFRVTTPSGSSFYLEAVVATEHSSGMTQHRLVATTLDVFTTNSHQNFCLSVRSSGTPKTQPSRRKLIKATKRWLDGLDPDQVQQEISSSGYGAAPKYSWKHEDFSVDLKAMPLRRERRGKATRLLAIQHGTPGVVDSWSSIRDALLFKGRRYGELDAPLVIAVNSINHHLDRKDEMQALFGQEQFSFSASDPDAEPTFTRAPNGAWLGKNGPQLTRASGAWIFSNFSTYTVNRADPTLYLNPWASLSVPEEMKIYTHACESENGTIDWHKRALFGHSLGLSETWPSHN